MALESLEPAIGHFNLGATKVRAGEAASVGAALAHQVHGAIGFTLEYELNLHTRRLWSWRDEFGNEAEWSSRVGHRIAAAGSGALWATITSAGNASSSATGTREEVRA
jgi:acyl-CoA dehydrogenase